MLSPQRGGSVWDRSIAVAIQPEGSEDGAITSNPAPRAAVAAAA